MGLTWELCLLRSGGMRTFALTMLTTEVALNGFLGYWGQSLADGMRVRLQTYGATVPAVTVMALALPPLFYVIGAAALLCAVLDQRRVISENTMVYAAFVFLILDIAVLCSSHFAFT